MENKIIGNSYIRLKNKPTKIYKVLTISDSEKFVEVAQKDNIRVILNYSDIELANDEDKSLYEDSYTSINYDE